MNRSTVVLLIALTINARPTVGHAVCSGGSVGGFTQYLAGQIPDIVLTSGVTSKRNITPYYVAFPSTGGHCGILARSTVPGTTITDTYGCGAVCNVHPAGEFAAVGSAYGVAFNVVAPNRTAGKNNYIPLAFDGSAPAGTEGFLELAFATSDVDGASTAFVFARVPIYVQSSATQSGWGRVVSTSSTVAGNRLILTHPYLDGRPSAQLFVSHVSNPTGTTSTNWDHHISVDYDGNLKKWTIGNADGAMMAAGLAFNYRIDPSAKRVCMAPPTTGNEFSSFLVVDDYNANENKWATLIVTPIGGPNRSVAVKYVDRHWGIVYSDGSPIPGGACFNIKVIPFSQYLNDPALGDLSGKFNTTVDRGTGVDAGADGTKHVIGGARMLQFNWLSRSAGSRMLHTSNLTPLGWDSPALADTKTSSLWISPSCVAIVCAYPSRRWAVRHADGSATPSTLRINVWGESHPCEQRFADARFVWAPRVVASNRRPQITFEQAKAAFADEAASLLEHNEESTRSELFNLLGSAGGSAPLVVSWYCDAPATIRIVSARLATARERARYEIRRVQ